MNIFIIVSIALITLAGIYACYLYFKREKIIKILNKTYPDYILKEIDDFLTHEECDLLIALSKDKIVQSHTNNADSITDKLRQSSSAFIQGQLPPKIIEVRERIAKLTNTKIAQFEDPQVTHYKVNQFYAAHYDADINNTNVGGQEVGMRLCTVIVYLNDDFKGGTTRFPMLKKIVTPKKGKAVYFQNLTNDNKGLHPLSLHMANVISDGEKWLMNQWIRVKPFK